MEHNQNSITPEAATDEPASLLNPTSRPGGGPPGDSGPASDEADGLISDRLACYVPVATDALGRRRRCDGLTPERQCVFLGALSRCGVAADAARAAGVSRDTAYELRNSAQGAAFALAWDAAILISRGRMGDELQSRALNGVVERIYRNGELWGERHRHDNRLAMAVLTRLDRQAEALGAGAATARAIAQEWDQFLDIVRDGGGGAARFLAARADDARMPDWEAPRGSPPDEARHRIAKELDESADALVRLKAYREFGGGLPGEGDASDLDPEAMLVWTEAQWLRADYCGLLNGLGQAEWPDSVRAEVEDAIDGTCRDCQDIPCSDPDDDLPPDGPPDPESVPGLPRACFEYRLRFPPEAPAPPERELLAIWEDSQLGWLTCFPPPEDFDGTEYGDWFEDRDYFRTLSPAEAAANEARLAPEREAVAAGRDAELAAACQARDRAFGFAGEAFQPAPGSDNIPPEAGSEGGAE